MSHQAIFISAVSKELKGARQLVANTLQFLGYEPMWQDIFGTEPGDLRAMLRRQIDGCKGVVQIVGQHYGAEPLVPDEQFGRVSYTQYEALYAGSGAKGFGTSCSIRVFRSRDRRPKSRSYGNCSLHTVGGCKRIRICFIRSTASRHWRLTCSSCGTILRG